MFFGNKRGFTVVELIFAISIVIILAAIAFFNFGTYNSSARDSSRLADISTINQSLTLFYTSKNTYPLPSDSKNITYSGAIIWKQGTVGDRVIQNLSSLSKKPIDPMTSDEYTYSVTSNGNEYQLATVLEKEKDDNAASHFMDKAYASTDAFAKTLGNYNGAIAFASTGGTDYALAIPSIVSGDSNETDILNILSNKKLVYNTFAAIPRNISHAFTQGTFDYNPSNIVARTGSISDLRKGKGYKTLSENLSSIYGASILNSFGSYQNLTVNTQKLLNKTGNRKFSLYSNCDTVVSSGKIASDGMYTVNPSDGVYIDKYCDIKKTGSNPYPTAALSVDFVAGKAWINGVVTSISSLFNVSRTGTATYEETDGSVKTFPANTLRYGTKGLLVEESRTNLMTYSQNLTTNWSSGFFGVPAFTSFTPTTNYSGVLAPDGTQTATRIQRTRSQANDGAFYSQNVSINTGLNYTFSMWARTTSGTPFTTKWGICCGGGLNKQPTITLDGSWKRFTLTGSVVADVNTGFRVITHESDQAGEADILIWGVQLEAADTASSYIPTTATAVTRARDSISITGTDFSNWYNASEGTLFVDENTPSNKSSRTIVAINSNSADNNYAYRFIARSSDMQLSSNNVSAGGNQYAEYISPSGTSIGSYRIVMGAKDNYFAGSINGSDPTLDTSGTLMTSNRLDVGATGPSYFMDVGYIKNLVFWPLRKSDVELKAISTQP